ncbi:hypothetical protein N007_06620 [Alicyclobacillus acidoterrestris ATCC 49025]|nr:hypothetical protein N007_06620 [Alicyclobacillus acidoterrestris ATCC 49025]
MYGNAKRTTDFANAWPQKMVVGFSQLAVNGDVKFCQHKGHDSWPFLMIVDKP